MAAFSSFFCFTFSRYFFLFAFVLRFAVIFTPYTLDSVSTLWKLNFSYAMFILHDVLYLIERYGVYCEGVTM